LSTGAGGYVVKSDAGSELLPALAWLMEATLQEGNAVIVIATDSHQASLLQRLTADGLNIPADIEQGSYIPLNVTDTLPNFMVNDSPDPVLFRKLAGDLITEAAKGAKGEHLALQSVEKASTLYWQRVTWKRQSCSNACGMRLHNITN
jgi:hypothetical protein